MPPSRSHAPETLMADEHGLPPGLFMETVRVYARLAFRVFVRPDASRPRPTPWRILAMLVFLPAFAALEGLHWLALLLDEWLFPGYRSVAVREPVFIVGVPRSGTTFLHRVLARDERRFTWFSLGELVFAPAIVEKRLLAAIARVDRRIGRPLDRLLRWVAGACTGGLHEVHRLALEEPEEDFLLLLPALGCFILVVAFPHDREVADLAYFDARLSPERRARLMGFYRSLVKRHLYAHGPDRTLLSKNVSFTPLLRSLLHAFPDCRLVVCTREPAAAVPSQTSSMRGGWRLFGNDTDSEDFRARWVALMRHYYAEIRDVVGSLPREQAHMVRMRDLTAGLEREVSGIYHAFGVGMSPAFVAALRAEAERAASYRSGHRYSADDCGLSMECIERGFSALYADGRDPRDETPLPMERPTVSNRERTDHVRRTCCDGVSGGTRSTH